MDNLIETIESQYANSPRLMALIDSFNESVDPMLLIDDFYDKVWNLDTAIGKGLDIWGRIVVIDRVVRLVTTKDYFWWNEAGADARGWGQAPWYRKANTDTKNYSLTDRAFRLAILVKAMANISDGTIKTYNRMLMTLFPDRGNVWVEDNFDMSITLRFMFELEPFEKALLEQSGIFPAPCGQKVLIKDTFLHMIDGLEMLDNLEMT